MSRKVIVIEGHGGQMLEQARRAGVTMQAFMDYARSLGVSVLGDSIEVTPEQSRKLERYWEGDH